MDKLAAFYGARELLGTGATFDAELLLITGSVVAKTEQLRVLLALDEEGYVRNTKVNGTVKNLALVKLSEGEEVALFFSLCPIELPFYEGLDDLLNRTESDGEPVRYFVFPFGKVVAGNSSSVEIEQYRIMLRAKALLRSVADLESAERAVFLTPQSLALPFICAPTALRELPELSELESQLEKNAVERDQRTALFKRSLREYLHTTPEEDRFRVFLKQFSVIYDSYRRDFLLWIGHAFGELEKSFEEKRLKFIADLNGILASVQTTILAVPLAVLLVGDKYDVTNPAKNFLLGLTVLAVAIVAHKLLNHQRHTLDSIDDAITSIEADFQGKHPQRKLEFKSRLKSLRKQQTRVNGLLIFLRSLIWIIVIVVFGGWFFSFYRTVPTSSWLPISTKTSSTAASQSVFSPTTVPAPSATALPTPNPAP